MLLVMLHNINIIIILNKNKIAWSTNSKRL